MTETERTEDGRYIVVNGRRWRATDPAIPKELRQELVNELMAARRAVRTDPASARPRVQDAKVALGERGDPWWEPTADGQRARLAAAMRTLLRHRDSDSTIGIADAARIAGGSAWQELLDPAREVAAELAHDGTLLARQHDSEVDPLTAGGQVRLARGPNW